MAERAIDLPETHALQALKVQSQILPTTLAEWLKVKTLSEIEALMMGFGIWGIKKGMMFC